MSRLREYRHYRVHCFGHFGGPGRLVSAISVLETRNMYEGSQRSHEHKDPVFCFQGPTEGILVSVWPARPLPITTWKAK